MKTTQTLEIPREGIAGLKENWKDDLLSGFLVFLIALPLCLAISLASGFPAISGIITAVVGGILVTLFHGSYLTIKGPAAGMIAIVLGSVTALGYETTLAVIVVSSIIQILFGLFRAGKLGDFFPSSAVHGMLAAIGVIIGAKQVYAALGTKAPKGTIEAIIGIPNAMTHMNPHLAVIGLISLVILFTLPNIRNKWVKKIPAPIIVLLIAIPLGHYLDLETAHKYIFNGQEYEILPKSALVPLPEDILEGLKFPDFNGLLSGSALYWIVMFCLVGSLESLLSTKAVDILDPYKRKANLNKDLFAVGLGNLLCGLLGALPMISEIVRSSANINNGGKTKWSNFFHGAFLLVFVLFFPGLIRQIPLAALGAMLVFTGYRLASPKVFAETYRVGKEQLLIFVTTLIVTLATDLIIGIFSGIAVKFIIHLIQGAPLKSLFISRVQVQKSDGNTYTLRVNDAAIFSNYLGFKRHLDNIPSGSRIIIDFAEAKLIDHTTMEHIHHYGEDYVRAGGELSIQGLEKFRSLSVHPLSYRVQSSGNEEKVPRSKQLKNLARSIHFSYKESYPVVNSNFGKFASDNLSVKYEGNIISGKTGEHIYTISDLSLVSGGAMKAQISQITVLSISNLHLGLPIFILDEELFIDKFIGSAFGSDINFNEFPAFSKKFKLQGINEKAIRSFFSKDIILFFEQNDQYCVESLGAELIIYKQKKMLSIDEIREIIEFGKNLVGVIEKRANRMATELPLK